MATFEAEDLARAVGNVMKFCPAKSLYPYCELFVSPRRLQAFCADRYAIATDSCLSSVASAPDPATTHATSIILHRDAANELESWLRALKRREVEVATHKEGNPYLRMAVWDEEGGEWIVECWQQDPDLDEKWVKHFESCHHVLRKAGGMEPRGSWLLQPHRLTALASVKVPGVSADDKAMEITPMVGVNTLRISMGDTFRALMQPLIGENNDSDL